MLFPPSSPNPFLSYHSGLINEGIPTESSAQTPTALPSDPLTQDPPEARCGSSPLRRNVRRLPSDKNITGTTISLVISPSKRSLINQIDGEQTEASLDSSSLTSLSKRRARPQNNGKLAERMQSIINREAGLKRNESRRCLFGNVADFTSSNDSASKQPPPTPRRERTRVSIFASPEAQNDAECYTSRFHELKEMIKRGIIKILQQIVSLEYLSKGSYLSVFTPVWDHQIVAGISNDELVVKVNHCENHGENSGLKDEQLRDRLLKNSKKNYEDAIQNGIPVAIIYNYETLLDDRFFLQEKVPYPVDINDPLQMLKVRQFFRISLERHLILDLNIQNLRVRNDKDSTVVLIDFVEDDDDDDNLRVSVTHALTSFCRQFAKTHAMNRKETEKFLEKLTEGLDQYQSDFAEWKKCALDACFC